MDAAVWATGRRSSPSSITAGPSTGVLPEDSNVDSNARRSAGVTIVAVAASAARSAASKAASRRHRSMKPQQPVASCSATDAMSVIA